VLCFLHDVGKLHPGFQAKGWASGEWNRPYTSHARAGAGLFLCYELQPIAEQVCKRELMAWGIADSDLLMAVLSHHGRPFEAGNDGARDWNTVRTNGGIFDPAAAATDIGGMIRRWFLGSRGIELCAPSILP